MNLSVDRAIADPLRDTVKIRWQDGGNAEYHVRGGICWPILITAGDRRRVIGHAIVMGVNTTTGRALLFGHQEFDTIDLHGLNTKGTPLTPFLIAMWSRFFAVRYYWSGDRETFQHYSRTLLSSPNVTPKPILRRVELPDPAGQSETLARATAAGQLAISQDLFDTIRKETSDTKNESPARLALVTVLAGLERWPWHNPDFDERARTWRDD